MDERRSLEVSNWQGDQHPLPVAHAPVSRRRIPARVLGIIGTLLLHGLVVPTALLGTSKKVSSSMPHSLAAAANAAGAESEMILVVVQPMEATNSKDSLFEDVVSRGSLVKDVPIAIMSPDPTPTLSLPPEQMSDNTEAESPVNSGDPAGHARLFGVYAGQIQARIDRVWRRPRTAVNEQLTLRQGRVDDETFRCQVRIIQDNQGHVQEILLPQCNGSAAWQRSLVLAIQQASPLPAPPSPSVFTNALTMTFTGVEFRPDRSPDDYEIEVPETLVQSNVNAVPTADVQRPSLWPDSSGEHTLSAPADEPPPCVDGSRVNTAP